MKGLNFDIRGKTFSVRFLSLSLASVTVTFQTRAQVITHTDNNSRARINVGSQLGMFEWSVLDGNLAFQNQLFQQWFWFRAGTMTNEQSIDTISAATTSTVGTRELVSSYFNGQYGVSVHYTLTGQSPNSYQSTMGEVISITNATASPLDFHFYQYSDFDLGGVTGGQTVQLVKGLDNLFKEADQTNNASFLTETVVALHASHGEAALYNSTLTKLNDSNADNLNDNAGPVGPGDATWALQWDFTIAAGSSVGFSKEKDLFVPEPSALALISLGLIAVAARRRVRSCK